MKKSIGGKTACMAAVFLIILVGIAGMFLLKVENKDSSVSHGEQILVLNEIEKLTEVNGKSPGEEQIRELQEQLQQMEVNRENKEEIQIVVILAGVCTVFIVVIFLYLQRVILRPFQELENYAGEIAKGNLEVELPYRRTNLFGAFTWAFDHMRREIVKARASEKEAIENNKTVIATLSHDIKTPIASIRAYAEGLEANMDTSPERRSRYLSVMMKKCDEVTKLTNDLFLHSLSDLERLQITTEEVVLKEFLEELLEGMNQQWEDIEIVGEISEMIVCADRKRLEQVVENIITNARKYAYGTPIRIWATTEKAEFQSVCQLHIKDGGSGVLPEDMPFVLEKFYRGKNVKNESGAGLGLYIADYIMKQMDGSVELKNSSDGLEVILALKSLTI